MRASIALALMLTACGSSSSPSSPTPPAPAQVTVTAALTETLTGATVGATSQTVDRLPALLTFSQPGYVSRQAYVGEARPTVDLIKDAAPFDMGFYRQLVRNGFEAPNTLQPVKIQATAPHIYIRTIDEAGAPIDAVTLNTADAAIQSVAALWTGGRFGIASIERGTGTHEGQSGWITVKWGLQTDACGRTDVGGTWIQLNYLNTPCACNGSKMRARSVKHEFGHAMGFWHTGDAQDLMSGLSVSACDQDPSARERYHASIAYSRQNGNRDPDNDAITSTPLSVHAGIVVVD